MEAAASQQQNQPPIQKEVVLRTPVLLGISGHQLQYAPVKTKYLKERKLHEDTIPPICESLPLGMVVDLPNDSF
jgi:hypothetical protein